MQRCSSGGVRWCAGARSAPSRCSTRASSTGEGLQGDGKIEDFEVVLLTPHGGDLQGFALLRGSEDQVSALRTDEEFARRVARADLIVESQGVVDALIGDGIARGMAQYQAEVEDLD
jgi:hypothetical protein